MELRSRVRHRLSADAVFTWEGPQRNKLFGEGLTRDISVAGAFIFTRTTPPLGAFVDLEILLSSPVENKGRSVQIKTHAKVIRVDHETNCEGFAATSSDFTLLFDRDTRDAFGISNIGNSDAGVWVLKERKQHR
jgi:PilZ domain